MAVTDTISASGEYRLGYRGLRDWLARIEQMGELVRINGAHWDREMGGITQMLTESAHGTAPGILFDQVPGYPAGYRTFYGHFSTIRRIALTLGLPLEYERKVDIVQAYHRRMQEMTLLPPRFVNDGPILENVLEGDAVDVLKFPVLGHLIESPTGCKRGGAALEGFAIQFADEGDVTHRIGPLFAAEVEVVD